MREILEKEVFPYVDKPGRYMGGEYNTETKAVGGNTRMALIYPDVYEVGISNLGIKIIYERINAMDGISCELAFSPWMDMEAKLRELSLPLYSLGSFTPLGEMDVLGFTFQYELLYSNFLTIMDLSNIPFYTSERTLEHPFIIVGGPAVVNLEPIAPFLDAVCVGDGETRAVEMVKAIREGKKAGLTRRAILEKLAEIEGVYVPSLYIEVEKDGYIIAEGNTVRLYAEPDLNTDNFTTRQVVPNIKAVQDRAVVEIMRGCTRGCRFCQAGMQYRPIRERSVQEIIDLAKDAIMNTGHREFSLISLSTSDYSNLPVLIEAIEKQFTSHGVSFSLPSLRLDTFNMELAKKVKAIRKSGLTFAVEGGTQEIRDRINKGVVEDELLNVVSIATELGWKSVKLYFMIGLPKPEGVEEDEVEGIIKLISKVNRQFPRMTVTVSVAMFVPKPHTPFQWVAAMTPEEGNRQFDRLLEPFRRNRKVSIRFNNTDVSYLEGVFARGDRRLARVVEVAYRKGARFDGWNEFYNLATWKEAFAECGVDMDFYLKAQDKDTVFPWEVIYTGVTREYMWAEWEKSKIGELTADCRDGCNDCGACDFDTIKMTMKDKDKEYTIDETFLSNLDIHNEELEGSIRFVYDKRDNARYLTQLDVEEWITRALFKANIPLKFTSGFNKHIRLEMGWALPVGFESRYEVSQFDLTSGLSAEEFIEKVNIALDGRITILGARNLPPYQKMNKHAKDQYIIFSFDTPDSEEKIRENYENNKEFVKVTPKRTKTIELSEYVKDISFKDGRTIITYFQTAGGARLQDIIMAITGLDTRQAVKLSPILHERYVMIDDKKVHVLDV